MGSDYLYHLPTRNSEIYSCLFLSPHVLSAAAAATAVTPVGYPRPGSKPEPITKRELDAVGLKVSRGGRFFLRGGLAVYIVGAGVSTLGNVERKLAVQFIVGCMCT